MRGTAVPSLNEVLQSITALSSQGVQNAPDIIRHQKLDNLARHTDRNVICYYSGWLNVNGKQPPNLSIDDLDKNGFMNTVEGMDCDKGLDLVLHTPGGSVTAAESIVYYLRKKFGENIRAIIPQMAMSAGTMIACGTKEIIMGHQSCIGPFDPSIKGVSTFAVMDEFARASEDIKKNPHNLPLWQQMISKYPPGFLEECERVIELATSIVPKWLKENMLKALDPEAQELITKQIINHLNNPTETKEHSRHVHFDKAKELGLVVTQLEDDQVLQDLVLTLHHAYMSTLLLTQTSKLIESHTGKRFILKY